MPSHRIKNWKQFQAHTHRESSPWVKWYKQTLRSDDWMTMPVERRWIWPALLLLVTDNDGSLPSVDGINRALGIGKYTPRGVKEIRGFDPVELQAFIDVLNNCSTTVQQSCTNVGLDIEIDIEIEKSRDREETTFARSHETAVASAPVSDALLWFPCLPSPPKQEKLWPLTGTQVLEWNKAWADVTDVLGNCIDARQWVLANPSKRKTYKGMPRFLVSWIQRAINNGTGRPPMSKAERAIRAERMKAAAQADREQVQRARMASARNGSDVLSVADILPEVVR